MDVNEIVKINTNFSEFKVESGLLAKAAKGFIVKGSPCATA